MSFAGDNTTTVKEKWTCFADDIQVHPIWHPSFVADAPSPTQLTVVWCHRGFGQWLFPDECCSKQGTFSMRSRRRMWCESMLRLDGFFVMAMRVSMISEKIYAMHSILFVFLIETVPRQCHNQWTHGWEGGWQCSIAIARCDELRCLRMFSMIWSLSEVLQGSLPGRSSRPAARRHCLLSSSRPLQQLCSMAQVKHHPGVCFLFSGVQGRTICWLVAECSVTLCCEEEIR